jgi:hypothetical protein
VQRLEKPLMTSCNLSFHYSFKIFTRRTFIKRDQGPDQCNLYFAGCKVFIGFLIKAKPPNKHNPSGLGYIPQLHNHLQDSQHSIINVSLRTRHNSLTYVSLKTQQLLISQTKHRQINKVSSKTERKIDKDHSSVRIPEKRD